MDSGKPSEVTGPTTASFNSHTTFKNPSEEKQPSTETSPVLTSFTLFPKLATEIRWLIWRLTLQSRVVEIEFSESDGFFSRVQIPVALKVSGDSRQAVISSYPVCFGNFIYTPHIFFNFSLDTLYFDNFVQNHVYHFLASLKSDEIAQIQRFAVDRNINFDYDVGDEALIDFLFPIKRAVPAMPALEELLFVYDLALWGESCFPSGSGAMQLFEEWPVKLLAQHECTKYMYDDEGDVPESDCVREYHDLPDSKH